MGEVRRVTSWRRDLHRGGCRGDRATACIRPSRAGTPTVWSRSPPGAPRRNVWPGPGSHLRRRLRADDPDAVVVVSVRTRSTRQWSTGRGGWCSTWWDSLSRSYRDRAEVVDGVSRTLTYRARGRAPAGRSPATQELHPSGCRRMDRRTRTGRGVGADRRRPLAPPSRTARAGPRRPLLRNAPVSAQHRCAGAPGAPLGAPHGDAPRHDRARRRLGADGTSRGPVSGTWLDSAPELRVVAGDRGASARRRRSGSLAPQACRSRCWTRRASDFPRWSRPRRWKATNRVFRCFPQATDGRISPGEIVRLLDDADAASLQVADTPHPRRPGARRRRKLGPVGALAVEGDRSVADVRPGRAQISAVVPSEHDDIDAGHLTTTLSDSDPGHAEDNHDDAERRAEEGRAEKPRFHCDSRDREG